MKSFSVYDLYTGKYLGRVKAKNAVDAWTVGEKRFGVPCTTKC